MLIMNAMFVNMEKIILAATEYTHLEFHNTFITLKLVLWGLYAGMLIALAMSFYRKVYLGSAVRKLLKAEALSEDSALTLAQLGIKGGPLMKKALKEGGTLRRYIEICGGTSPKEISGKKKKLRSFLGMEEEPLNYDFYAMKLYIPEEKKYKADIAFERGNLTPALFVVFVILLTALVIGINVIIPELLTMLDNFLGIIIK